MNVGIYGIGYFLPPVRTNDWWPSHVVDEWRVRAARSVTRFKGDDSLELTEGMQMCQDAIAQYKDDPFEGAVKRHAMAADMRSTDMETEAARDAIARAGVRADEIDFILTQSVLPNFIHVSNACLDHKQLNLRADVFSLATEGMCNSFQQQFVLASALISAGRFRTGLLIQSCNMTAFTPPVEHFSAWFGDGATAEVVGQVPDGVGLLADAHMTDGTQYGAIVTGIPDRPWYEDGRIIAFAEKPGLARVQFLKIPDEARQLVERALARAGHVKDDVEFWACHQATAWLGDVTQRHIGLKRARRVDTYRETASMSGCNIPMVLATAEREGTLRPGELIASFSGAAGMAGSSLLFRWGRG